MTQKQQIATLEEYKEVVNVIKKHDGEFTKKQLYKKLKICKLCPKELSKQNKSGYCMGCYRKSEEYKSYQREYQRKFYQTPERKAAMKAYNATPARREKLRECNRKWREKNKDKYKATQKAWREAHPNYNSQSKPIANGVKK